MVIVLRTRFDWEKDSQSLLVTVQSRFKMPAPPWKPLPLLEEDWLSCGALFPIIRLILLS